MSSQPVDRPPSHRGYWAPHVTVAAIIERGDRFLMVEEMVSGVRVFNQPAGHLEPRETLIDAVAREVLEETGWRFQAEGLVGVYHWRSPTSEATFLRTTFFGRLRGEHTGFPLDEAILGTHWLTREDLDRNAHRLRSPMVLRGIDDYLGARRYPLELLQSMDGGSAGP